jgi:hypothetical protein
LLLDLIFLAMAKFFISKHKGLVHLTLIDLENLKDKNVE